MAILGDEPVPVAIKTTYSGHKSPAEGFVSTAASVHFVDDSPWHGGVAVSSEPFQASAGGCSKDTGT